MRPLLFILLSACSGKISETASNTTDDADIQDGSNDGSDDGSSDGSSDGTGDGSDGPTPGDDDGDEDTPDDEDDTTPPDEDDEDDEDDDMTPGADLPDLSSPGPTEVNASSGSYTTSDGCDLSYERYTPYEPTTDGEVFVLHGFMRSLSEFSELAEHLASWGMTTTTVTMCHSSVVDIQPVQNAADVIELADHLGAPNVVWMGHSNGGVSAMIAGAMEPAYTEAVLGLDPVEAITGDGSDYAVGLDVPLAAMFGEPDSCNSDNSGFPVFDAATDARLLRLTEADHCNFEAPTNWLCTLTCARTKATYSDAMISDTIFSMSTAWALGHLEDGFDMRPWWTPAGAIQSNLRSAGAVSSL